MALYCCAVSDRRTPIELRERLSFTRGRVLELDRRLKEAAEAEGCVLLSTCNRTELYCACSGAFPDGPALLCRAAGLSPEDLPGAFQVLTGEEAFRHLLEVAAGLRSRIWGEDQILTQVRAAIALSREAGSACPELETAFRVAVSAGKRLRTRVRLTGVPTSAPQRAVEVLREQLGGLTGKRVLVIGNGEMGRLSARLLREAGCSVNVTLRSYRHGETVVPTGCGAVPYEDRFAAMEGVDLLLSATVSPHYTVTAQALAALKNPPRFLVDLAIPRDIEPAVGELPGVKLYNIDTLGERVERTVPPEGEAILTAAREEFRRWWAYRAALPALEEVQSAALERLRSEDLSGLTPEEAAALAARRTVELLAGNLPGGLSAEALTACAQKIRAHTRD